MAFINPGSLEELKRNNEVIIGQLREQLELNERLDAMERTGARRGGVSPTPTTYAPATSHERENVSRMIRDEVQKEAGISARRVYGFGRGISHAMEGASSIRSRDYGNLVSISANIGQSLGILEGGVATSLMAAAGPAALAAILAKEGVDFYQQRMKDEMSTSRGYIKTLERARRDHFDPVLLEAYRGRFENESTRYNGAYDNFKAYFGFGEKERKEEIEKKLNDRLEAFEKGGNRALDNLNRKWDPQNFMHTDAVRHALEDAGMTRGIGTVLFDSARDRERVMFEAASKEADRLRKGEEERQKVMQEQWLEASTDGVMNRVIEKQHSEYFRAIEHDRILKYNDWNRF